MTQTGYFIAVVGKSGVGKDTILDGAKLILEEMKEFHFVKRYITRSQDAGGEIHNPISVADFKNQQKQGNFALWWPAHGLFYGLPKDILGRLKKGQNVIANISRKSVINASHKFENMVVFEITASPQTINQRLIARGRDSKAEITKRRARNVKDWAGEVKVIPIANDGQAQTAIDKFIKTSLDLVQNSL